jgi:hypothetical protein
MATDGGEEVDKQRIVRITDIAQEPLETLLPIEGFDDKCHLFHSKKLLKNSFTSYHVFKLILMLPKKDVRSLLITSHKMKHIYHGMEAM